MDELERKSQKGLNEFKKTGSMEDVKASMDSLIDGMFDQPDEEVADDTSGEKSSSSNPLKKWGIAAVLLLLLSAIGYIGYQDGNASKSKKVNPNPKVLFAQYFEPMEDLTSDVSRGESSRGSEELSGMDYYNQKDYKKAATLLLSQSSPESQVYGALSLMNDGNTIQAVELFNNMLKDDKYQDYNDILSWYLALSDLSNGNIESAKTKLQTIAGSNSFKKSTALQLLDKL